MHSTWSLSSWPSRSSTSWDYLVVLKVLAGRPKDEEDVAMLVRIHGAAIDHERIESVLRALQDALGRSDLLPAFTRARCGRR